MHILSTYKEIWSDQFESFTFLCGFIALLFCWRYENNNFFTEANIRGNVGVCGNQTSSITTFRETVTKLLSDLRVATPKMSDFYAASIQHATGSNVRVYAIAQCNINISQSDCAECLSIRTATLSDCLPNTFGRAIDVGCFMRYSNTAFFRDNQTTDLTPFLKDGKTSFLQMTFNVLYLRCLF